MNISETMASIRWLFDKHCKDDFLPIAPATVEERKERAETTKVSVDLAVEAMKMAAEGKMTKDIARHFATSSTTISNIINKKNAYKTMPSTEQEIRAWFKQRKRK